MEERKICEPGEHDFMVAKIDYELFKTPYGDEGYVDVWLWCRKCHGVFAMKYSMRRTLQLIFEKIIDKKKGLPMAGLDGYHTPPLLKFEESADQV